MVQPNGKKGASRDNDRVLASGKRIPSQPQIRELKKSF
jgi:hypothetical protein